MKVVDQASHLDSSECACRLQSFDAEPLVAHVYPSRRTSIHQSPVPQRIIPSRIHRIVSTTSLNILLRVIIDVVPEALAPRSIQSFHVAVVSNEQLEARPNVGSRDGRDHGLVAFVARVGGVRDCLVDVVFGRVLGSGGKVGQRNMGTGPMRMTYALRIMFE